MPLDTSTTTIVDLYTGELDTMANPAMVSAAVAAIGATGLGTMYVADKKQQEHTFEKRSPLIQAGKEKTGDGFSGHLAV